MQPEESGAANRSRDRAEALLDALNGSWQLRRRIVGSVSGRLCGTMRFEPEADGLTCVESGTLRMPGGPPLQTERRTLWRPGQGGIAVRFADGRPFFTLDLSGTVAEVTHLCGADVYRGRVDVRRWPDWSLAWRVTGPRKDYAMVSRLSRPEAHRLAPGAQTLQELRKINPLREECSR